jgi:hypothetical protein
VRFGLDVSDPSESLGTEDRCHVLEEIGFDSRDVQADGAHGQLLLLEQMRVIPPERLRPKLLESASAVIALAGAQGV